LVFHPRVHFYPLVFSTLDPFMRFFFPFSPDYFPHSALSSMRRPFFTLGLHPLLFFLPLFFTFFIAEYIRRSVFPEDLRSFFPSLPRQTSLDRSSPVFFPHCVGGAFLRPCPFFRKARLFQSAGVFHFHFHQPR